MLALNKIGEHDTLLAKIYKNEKSDEVLEEIWYTPKFTGDSELYNDDIEELLEDERLTIQKDTNITAAEFRQICADVKSGKPVDPDYSRSLKKAFLQISELFSHKLKREFVISKGDKDWLRYNYDTSKPNTNNFQLYCGTSGSGKTVALVRATLLDPHKFHYSKVTLIGTTQENDPSYEPLRKYFGPKYEYINTEEITAEQCRPDYYPRNSAVIFDDTQATIDRKRKRMVQDLIDRMLTTGRHRSLKIIAVVHLFNSYRETAKLRNCCATYHIFTRTVPQTLLQILDKMYGWGKNKREAMLRMCQRDGRMTVFRMAAPQAIITSKRIVLL